MKELIKNYVPEFDGQKTTVNGYDGYKSGDIIYFTIPKPNNEEIHYEQKAISDYLIENGIENVASPLMNLQGQIATQIDKQDYLVCASKIRNYHRNSSHAKRLASFHNIGTDYPYAPNYISSYGQWKTLWQNKISTFENLYNQQYYERPVSRFQRLFIDTFPYIVGLSENALQYLQEAETDWRYHSTDQASVTFQRYTRQLQGEVMWSHELTYDHPVRDIAEYVRPFLLEDDYQSLTKVQSFLTEYQQVRAFSIFGWRLLFARLIFPIHLFDFIEAGISTNNQEEVYSEYKLLLEKHANYEKNLKNLYSNIGVDTASLNIPVLDW